VLFFAIYMALKAEAEMLMDRYHFLNGAYKLLLNRLYIDAFYLRVAHASHLLSQKIHNSLEYGLNTLNGLIASLFSSLAKGAYKYVEMEGITKPAISGFSGFFDIITNKVFTLSQWVYPHLELGGLEAVNHKFAEAVAWFSSKIRKIQTGVLSYNVSAMLVGIVLIAILTMYFGGIL
jgi:hypothetical protein